MKRLNLRRLNNLAAQIRTFLIKSVSETGGHLASNLGVVELTLALHYCFNSPEDKIIWDVGHQSYVHKILTGRAGRFGTLRRYGGLSGFPKPAESAHDPFGTGHASTSISAALGLAVARDLRGENHSVIAVIGDGSMTGGLAFEGLNHAGRSGVDLIVILNDNQMSISENVGALHRYLNNLRTAPSYIGAKAGVKTFLNRFPGGSRAVRLIEKTKGSLKHTLLNGTVFDEYGFNYIGPVDGHNLSALIKTLKGVKNMKGPVLVHVYTTKGKGYAAAERQPAKYHGISPFEVEDSEAVRVHNTYSEVFGAQMLKLAAKDSRVLTVTAAMPDGTGLAPFAEQYPERFFDVGIAEAHAVTFAAGLAGRGFKPVVAIYSTFLQRAYDQILHDVFLQGLPVVFAIDRAGVVAGDGETHHGLYDLAYLSHIPGMVIMSPKNRYEFCDMLDFALSLDRPCCIRYPRAAASGALREYRGEVKLGLAECLCAGGEQKKAALIALGDMVEPAVRVVRRLENDGFTPRLYNARFVRPIDTQMIKDLREFEYICTIENAAASGGLGAAVAGELTRLGVKARFRAFSFPDAFVPQGTCEQLLRLYGLNAESLYKSIKEDLS